MNEQALNGKSMEVFGWKSDLGLSGEALVHFVSATTYPLASAFTTLAPFGVVAPNARVGSYILLNLRPGTVSGTTTPR